MTLFNHLRRHLKRHTDSKVPPILEKGQSTSTTSNSSNSCECCTYTSAFKANMKRHKQTHSQDDGEI